MVKIIIKKNGGLTGLVFLIVAAMIAPVCGAAEKVDTPWDFNRSGIQERKAASDEKASSIGSALIIGAVRIYQNHLSPILGDHCPMYPTCSAYSIEAVKKHGFFIGVMMTTDRLIRENTEMDLAPLIKVSGEFRNYDSVENNDFWWAGAK